MTYLFIYLAGAAITAILGVWASVIAARKSFAPPNSFREALVISFGATIWPLVWLFTLGVLARAAVARLLKWVVECKKS